MFLLFLIWSPLGRFFIEFLRTDSWFFPGTPFNTVHLITAIMVIGASITFFLRHRGTTSSQVQSVDETSPVGEDETSVETKNVDDAEQINSVTSNASVDSSQSNALG